MKYLRKKVSPKLARQHAERTATELLSRKDISDAIVSGRPICVYLATGDEIDLSPFISGITKRGGTICVPRWNGNVYTLSLAGEMRKGPHGIPEPAIDRPIEPQDASAWITPGLAFTTTGERLGYGGGWYDRFFAAADPTVPRIGVAYPFQILPSIPSEEHDIPLSAIVAPITTRTIGFFDSGLGGLSVWQEAQKLLPEESTDYIADSANCPYGDKAPEEIMELSRKHTRTLLARGAKMIVVACNTATAAAIDTLRREWPDIPFVGMEPAVKPAALASKSGVVGVLATRGTFNGRLWRETSARFAANVKTVTSCADGFVECVENGKLDGEETERIVRNAVMPLLEAGADHIVLGCTHFPFLAPVIERVVAGRAKLVNPAPAVARRIRQLLAKTARNEDGNPCQKETSHRFETTGATASLERMLKLLSV